MIVPSKQWHWDGPCVVIDLECHPVYVYPSWIRADGTVSDRLQCTASGCRKIYEGVRLEGWSP